MPPRLAILGNPGHRRVTGFVAAARAAGLPDPTVLPWLDLLRGTGSEVAPGTVLRMESPGEDVAVDRLLRGPALGEGYAATRVEGSAAWYDAMTAALRTVATRPGVRLLGDPEEIAVMFDKRRTHARLAAAGVPVPRTLPGPAPTGWTDLRNRLAPAGLRRVFVKPTHGSSAAGVVALEFGPRGQLLATTSVETSPDGLHNSLRVRRYRGEPDIADLVDRLAPDGLHVEQWVPKAAQSGRSADLRVVVIRGRATHVVVRTSRHPMTNLHLGGARGDVSLACRTAGAAWPALIGVAEQAAACFPNSPMVGVDLLPTRGWRAAVVGEVNAFGDLLPGAVGLPGTPAAGLDTYGAQIAALLADTPATNRYPYPTTRNSAAADDIRPARAGLPFVDTECR